MLCQIPVEYARDVTMTNRQWDEER